MKKIFALFLAVPFSALAVCDGPVIGPGDCQTPTIAQAAHVKRVECAWDDLSVLIEIDPVSRPLAGQYHDINAQCALIRWAVESGIGAPQQ